MLEIHRQKQRLDELFKRASDMPDAELQSHWCRYLCVLVSGFIENSVEHCLAEYTRRRSNENVANFIQAKLVNFQNPKMGLILELLGSFNTQWKERLEKDTQGQLSDSVNSIVGNRHKIAHGESVSLSLNSLKAYYDDAVIVLGYLRDICGV